MLKFALIFRGSTPITTTIPNLPVVSSGTVNAVVSLTGAYGDRGLTDYFSFGKTGTTLTALADPTTGVTNDALNSTIGFCAQNNVSVVAAGTGFPIPMSGNFTSRNPYNTFSAPGSAVESCYYDADSFNATGILAPSATPISVTLSQNSGGGDVIGSGVYAIAVDLAASVLTKSISPSTIIPGGTAAYTWTVDNTKAGALNLTGISFVDNLPSGIMAATPPGANHHRRYRRNYCGPSRSNSRNINRAQPGYWPNSYDVSKHNKQARTT